MEQSFFRNGFYRSANGTDYSGLFILWNLDESNQPQVGLFYINSWLKFRPKQFLSKEEHLELKERMLARENFVCKNLMCIFDDLWLKVSLSSEGSVYDFSLTEREFLEFKNHVVYCNNYIENFPLLQKVATVNTHLADITKNNQVLNVNKIVTRLWEQKDIFIPFIEESFHVFKDWKKCSYYFKFFPQYLDSFKNGGENGPSNMSGSKYPLQIIVQGEGKSEVITATESEFQIIYLFLHNEEFFLKDGPLTRELKAEGMLHVQESCTIELENTYNGKTYRNKDSIDEKVFLNLKSLLEAGKYSEILQVLTGLKERNLLQNNRFINLDVVKTLKISNESFVNIKISRSDRGELNASSWILQLSKAIGSQDYTINVMKGDLSDEGIKFATAPISKEKLFDLKYKTECIMNFLINPVIWEKQKLLSELGNIKYAEEMIDISHVEKDLYLLYPKKLPLTDKVIFGNDEFTGTINIFYPGVSKSLNSSLFKLKEDIADLKEERYFSSLYLKDSLGEKITNFSLSVWELINMRDALNSNERFEVIGKSWTTFKKLKITKKDESVQIMYGVSTKPDTFMQSWIKFNQTIDLESFLVQLKMVIDRVGNLQFLLDTGIVKEKSEIFLKNNALDKVSSDTKVTHSL